MSATRSVQDLAFAEIEELHRFFVLWFTDGSERPIDFGLCERAFAGDFALVNPDGSRHDRQTIVRRLVEARGRVAPPFEIAILDMRTAWLRDDAILVEYIERQQREGSTTQRRSAALLTTDDAAPRGMVWRFLQETWLAPGQA